MRIERWVLGVLLGAGMVARAAGEDPVAAGPRLDVTVLDRSVNPCTDFYRFACGGWIDQESPTEKRVQWTRLHALDRKNVARLRELLREQLAGQAKDPVARKMQDLHASCMDQAAIEAGGLAQLQEELAHYARLDTPVAFAEALARLHQSGIRAPFVFAAVQEQRNPSKLLPTLVEGDGDRESTSRGEYLLSSVGLLDPDWEQAGPSVAELQEEAGGLFNSREAIAEEVRHRWHRLTLQELEKRAPRVAWRTYFARMGAPNVDAVQVRYPGQADALDALLGKAPASSWSRYFQSRVVALAAERGALPRALNDGARRGDDGDAASEREERCGWLTLGTFAEPLGEIFEARTLGPDGLRRGQALMNDLQAALASQLQSAAWLDGSTRAEGLAKVRRIVKGIGHPAPWSGYAAVPISRTSFLRNVLEAEGLPTRRDYEQMGKPADRAAWGVLAVSAEADYRRVLDQLAFPAGLLQAPLFGPEVPEPFTYGALGWLGGSALMSGFDLHGRQYDASGRLRDWWSEEMLERNQTTVECLVKQYSKLEGPGGEAVRGDMTAQSNFADNAGVRIALGAFRAASARKKYAEQGGLTAEQQFFVGVAQSQCSKLAPGYSSPLVEAPPNVRVNGTLANVPEFEAAFHCPAGSPMVRAEGERCAFW